MLKKVDIECPVKELAISREFRANKKASLEQEAPILNFPFTKATTE
jgi:hypothetical protein